MTSRALLFVVTALLLVIAVAARSSAQTKGVAPGRTTLGGVYTAAQATSGEEVYGTFCVSCHPFVTYTGPAFKLHWQGRPLSDLFEWVSEKMPKNDPGSLTPKQAIDAVAFILRLNKLPAGQTPLPADYAVLGKIKIELK